MGDEILRTDVDDFIALVKEKGKLTIKDAAKMLGVPDRTVEVWTDFLVEERILGTEYKFTTQYIYLNLERDKNAAVGHGEVDTKEDFFEKAKTKKIPEHQAKMLWFKYLTMNEAKIKDSFMKKAKTKGLSLEKTKELWGKYYRYLKMD